MSGLRTVMYRLWPPDAHDWHEEAEYFLEFCEEAGLGHEQLLPSLRARFSDILGEQV